MQTLKQTTTGAASWEINIPGRYFAILDCTYQVNVKLFKGGKKLDLGEISGVMSGLECMVGDPADREPAFDRVIIETSAADTVTVGIGNGQVRYSRGGNQLVTVINTYGPFVHSAVAVGLASVQLRAAAQQPRYLLIQNRDLAGSIWVNLDGNAATQANGIKIGPGGSLELNTFIPNGAINAISDIAAAAILVVTG